MTIRPEGDNGYGAVAGLKVLDFTWYGVGPIATKYLADNGAEVVKVESRARPDGIRMSPPWKDGVRGINRSHFFGNFNSSKKSITLDMRSAQGPEVVRRLVPHFDIVADSFTAGTMERWGLGYGALRQLRGDIIQFSTCMQGQTGPNSRYPGFGNLMAALCGFYHATGYSADDIAPPYGAYTDFIAPRFGCVAILLALEHRRQTGEGQFIDMSQYEAALHFLAPAITNYFATGTVLQPDGNRSRRYAPHGAYRVRDDAGRERWVALAVASDREWEALLQVVGGGPGPAEFVTHVDRVLQFRDVDAYVQSVIRDRKAGEIVPELQAAGVAAYTVQDCLDLHADENLRGFGFWRWLEQSECGFMPYDGLAYRLDGTPGEQKAAPSIGEDTAQVLAEVLGMSESEIAGLVADGTIY